jgi:hypothetical protein
MAAVQHVELLPHNKLHRPDPLHPTTSRHAKIRASELSGGPHDCICSLNCCCCNTLCITVLIAATLHTELQLYNKSLRQNPLYHRSQRHAKTHVTERSCRPHDSSYRLDCCCCNTLTHYTRLGPTLGHLTPPCPLITHHPVHSPSPTHLPFKSYLYYALLRPTNPHSSPTLQTPRWKYSVTPAEQEDPAVLLILQTESDPSKRKEIELADVFKSFGTQCIAADTDPVPKNSIKPIGKTGPWKVFDTYHKVATITDALQGSLTLTTKDHSIPCSISCHRLTVAPRLDEAFDRQFADRESLHLMFQLREEWEFRWVEANHLRESLERAGLLVLMANRPAIGGLGTSGYQGIVHVRARPIDSTTPLFNWEWPMYFTVDAGEGVWRRKAHPLIYEIGEHLAVAGKLCLRRRPCHRPFRPRKNNPDEETCNCNKDDADKRTADEERAKSAAIAKRKTVEQSTAEFREEMTAKKKATPCPHLLTGKCDAAKHCGFLHSSDALADAMTRPCILPKRGRGCTATQKAGKCYYLHNTAPFSGWAGSSSMPISSQLQAEIEGAAAALSRDDDEMMCKRQYPYYSLRHYFKPRRHRHLPKRTLSSAHSCILSYVKQHSTRFSQRWNSSLGYPGEGPPQPITVATWNARGLVSGGRLDSLLRQAATRGIHILLIQEHNLIGKHRPRVESVCKRRKFHPYVAYLNPNLRVRGGAAVFVTAEHPDIDCRDARPSFEQQAGVASVLLTEHEERKRYTSVYVPVFAPLRRVFLTSLANSSLVTSDCVVGGDWNCVPDITCDVQYPPASSESYPNLHAPILESLLTKRGLIDIHRFVNGNAISYTRLCDTTFTRLDRIYSKKYNSNRRWTSVKTEPSLFRSDWTSDHHAVTATFEVPTDRDPTPIERRIDPHVYQDPEVRARVRKAWHAVYKSFDSTYTAAAAWEYAKQTAATILIDATQQRKARRQQHKTHLRSVLDYHISTAPILGPSPQFHSTKQRLEKQVATARDPEVKHGYWAYLSSLGEEVMSKKFLRKFKARYSNSDISSLHITPDWTLPTERDGVTTTPEGILESLQQYYTYLFRNRPSIDAEPLLELLREKSLPTELSAKIEGDITTKEVVLAINKMGKAKSPGPDLLPAEFYQTFLDLVVDPLTNVLNEAHARHELPSSTKQGIVKLLYKKGDPRDVRNYRPLTMLNTDYKILTSTLNRRIAKVIHHIVSSPQLGFVPGRIITEASHLAKLIQAYLDEKDEGGVLIALDWEKAFDSISWDYLHASVEALGFGPDIQRWYSILYNPYDPQQRTIQSNGKRSPSFSLFSGIPQGCPLSPLTFIFVSEALTRLVKSSPNYKGINIAGRQYRLSQFADDTLLFLRSYSGLRTAWRLIKQYSLATGMMVNMKKTEGIRCGRLKTHPPPIIPELNTDLIQWVQPNKWVRLLGIPFWEAFDPSLFWDSLYHKAKGLMACWHTEFLTSLARSRVAVTMYLSRFRYWYQCMLPPQYIQDAIDSDLQAFTWAKNLEMDPNEIGCSAKFRRWMQSGAQYSSRILTLGLGLLPWNEHCTALRARWIFRYLDATCGDYKHLLDQWFAREPEGRSLVFSTYPANLLTKSLSYHPSALPTFWKQALADFRSLPITRTHPNQLNSADEAAAIPLWWSPLFNISRRAYIESWRTLLHITRIRDTLSRDNRLPHDHGVMTNRFRSNLRSAGSYAVRAAQGKVYTINSLLRQWDDIIRSIPDYIMLTARTIITPKYQVYGMGAVILRRCGWREGTGVGANPGITEPIPNPPTTKGRAGLDFVSKPSKKTLAIKRKSRFRVIRRDDELIYGTYQPDTHTFSVYSISTDGHPHPTHTTLTIDPHLPQQALWWGKGIVGPAVLTFPHPDGWIVAGPDCPLDKITVKKLTLSLTLPKQVLPTCMATWERRLGDIDWRLVGNKYHEKLITPKDFMSHFKLILHNALLLRHKDASRKATGAILCRLCGGAEERCMHFPRCRRLTPIWNRFIKLTNITIHDDNARDRLILLGLSDPPLPKALSDFHLILWKFILIPFTLVDLKNKPFTPDDVWTGAIRRYLSKANSLTYRVGELTRRAEATNSDVNLKSVNSLLNPLGKIDASGIILWNNDIAPHAHGVDPRRVPLPS